MEKPGPGRWRKWADPCPAQGCGVDSETRVTQGDGARLGLERRRRGGPSCTSPISPEAPQPHWPSCLSRSYSVPRKGGSAAFLSQKPPSPSLPLPGLSLPSSKMERLDKMLTEEARDSLGTRPGSKCHRVFCLYLFSFFFHLRGKVTDNKGRKELKALF